MGITGAFILLCLGWFAGGRNRAVPFQIETARNDPPAQTVSAQSPALPEEKININTADADTLALLPGIGAVRAGDIIAYREEHGPFAYPEDITKVKGIGQATLARLIDLIVTEDESP